MKGSLIVEGGVYAWRTSKYGHPRRCIVLDAERTYQNRFVHFWARDDNVVTTAWRSRHGTGRFLVAIEVPSYVDEDGHVWEESGSSWRSFGGSAKSDLPPGTAFTEWLPWAARSAELLSTWEVQEERDAEEERERQAVQRIRDRAEKRRRERNAEMEALRVEGAAWRKGWHEERDRRREIETHQRIQDGLVALLESALPEHVFPESFRGVAELICEEFDVDLREPLPDPLQSLFSGP